MDTGKLKIVAIGDNRDNLGTFQAVIGEAFPEVSFFPATDGPAGSKPLKPGLFQGKAQGRDWPLFRFAFLNSGCVCRKIHIFTNEASKEMNPP